MTAQTWFIAGTIPPIIAGGLHAALTLVDTVSPRYFTPRDDSLRPALEDTPIRFAGRSAPTMWRAWLGFNISHGLGVMVFGLLCLLIASSDFGVIERIDAIRPLTVAVSACYLALAVRFWFWGPVVICGTATACFTIAWVLSA